MRRQLVAKLPVGFSIEKSSLKTGAFLCLSWCKAEHLGFHTGSLHYTFLNCQTLFLPILPIPGNPPGLGGVTSFPLTVETLHQGSDVK